MATSKKAHSSPLSHAFMPAYLKGEAPRVEEAGEEGVVRGEGLSREDEGAARAVG